MRWIREKDDDDLLALAMQSDMRFSAELLGMVLHEPPEAPQLLPGVEGRRVENVQCFQDFREIAAQGFRDEARVAMILCFRFFGILRPFWRRRRRRMSSTWMVCRFPTMRKLGDLSVDQD